MRKATKLLLTMTLIGCVHAGILFVAYGRRWLDYWPYKNRDYIWVLVPSCAAFYLYYFSLSRAGIVAESHRRVKLVTISSVATLISLYLGVFFSFNVYGE